MGRRGQSLIEIAGLHVVAIRRTAKPVLWYVYAWRGGPCIRKQAGGARPVLTPADVKAQADAFAASHKVKADTFAGLARKYRKSTAWLGLQDSTRRIWSGHLDVAEARWAETPIKFWSDPRMTPKIVAWRDSRAATPRTADIGITMLQHMLKWARLEGLVTVNLADGIPAIDTGGDRAEIIWTQADLDAIRAVAPWQVMDGIDLARLTGLRRADLVRVTFDHVGEAAIILTGLKKSRGKRRRIVVPILPELRELLDRLRGRSRNDGVHTLLVNAKGDSWSGGGFGQRFNQARDKANGGAGIVHKCDEPDILHKAKHLHDLRGTYCTEWLKVTPRLTDDEVAGIMGWSPQQVATIRRRYVDESSIIVALAERRRAMGL